MTAIQGYIKPTRRPGELGVHSLDHFHFAVPDLATARNFYGEFGLDVGGKGNLLTLNTFEHTHTWGTIGEGPRKKFGYVSFGAFEDDMERFSERLQAMGIGRLDPPPGIDSNGLWFRDHDGVLVEIKVAAKSSPDQKTEFSFKSGAPGERGAPFRSKTPRTRPRRLAHVLMFTRDVRKAIEFYTRVLGLRLSDHSGDNIAFLHGIHGSDHHMIAFAVGGPRPSSFQLGRRFGRRDRSRRHAHAGQGLRKRLGSRSARDWVELLSLRSRSVGQLQRIFRRYRLCSGHLRLAGWRSTGG
jgi:catechol 2,3-dioxygenase-like lactoylglutathione lyase family enzyme